MDCKTAHHLLAFARPPSIELEAEDARLLESHLLSCPDCDALARVERLYRPYHRALSELIGATQQRFGYSLVIDCHSMPSMSAPHERGGRPRVDFVLGDCHGTSCHPVIIEAAQMLLDGIGKAVIRDDVPVELVKHAVESLKG